MDEGTIVRILQGLGSRKIKRSGNGVMASCPFAPYSHASGEDKNPSFSMKINPGGDSPWKCFTCGKKGNAKGLIYQYKESGGGWRSDLWDLVKGEMEDSLSSKMSKLGSWDDQRRRRAKEYGPSLGSDWIISGYEKDFKLEDYAEILKGYPAYAEKRGITLDQAVRWNLGFDQKEQRLFIPIFDENNKMVGYSGRSIHKDIEPKYKHAENMRRDKYLYGEHLVDKTRKIGYITEGFMDVWALERYGLKNCLGVMGTACSYIHVEKLRKWFDVVVIFPHNDPAGRDGKHPGMEMAEAYKVALQEKGVRAEQQQGCCCCS